MNGNKDDNYVNVQLKPFTIILLASVTGTASNLGLEIVKPNGDYDGIHQSTILQLEVETERRKESDARIWETIVRLQDSCTKLKDACRDTEEDIRFLKHELEILNDN